TAGTTRAQLPPTNAPSTKPTPTMHSATASEVTSVAPRSQAMPAQISSAPMTSGGTSRRRRRCTSASGSAGGGPPHGYGWVASPSDPSPPAPSEPGAAVAVAAGSVRSWLPVSSAPGAHPTLAAGGAGGAGGAG